MSRDELKKEQSTIQDRLKDFIDSQHLSIREFERINEFPNGTIGAISDNITSNRRNTIVENFPMLNISWLLTGEGEMLREGRPAIKVRDSSGIPLLPFDAFAGIGSDEDGVDFNAIEERYIVPLFNGIKVDFMVNVSGSSMYPKYNSGDVVACRLVKELLFVQWNKVYVLDTISQGVIIKRLKQSEKEGFVVCKSDNESYDPFEIPMSDIRNMALVIGVIRLE